MVQEGRRGFFADRSSLKMEEYVVLDYYFECAADPEEAAAHLCQEQSTAQWKRVGVDEDLRDRFGAKVIDLRVERVLDKPTYPFRAPSTKNHMVAVSRLHIPMAILGRKSPTSSPQPAAKELFTPLVSPPSSCLIYGFPTATCRIFKGRSSESTGCVIFWRSMIVLSLSG